MSRPVDPVITALRQARVEQGYSIHAASRALGFKSPSIVGMWESGVRRPSINDAHRYAQLLGLTLLPVESVAE